MKQSKKLLAVLLALVLAFTLVLPALAIDEAPIEKPNPAASVIANQDDDELQDPEQEQEMSLWKTIWHNYIAGPIQFGVGYTIVSVAGTFGLLLPFSPIFFVIGWAIGLFKVN